MSPYCKDVHKQIQKRLDSLCKLRGSIDWATHDISVLLEIIEELEKEIAWLKKENKRNKTK
jgi:hypothetical protein